MHNLCPYSPSSYLYLYLFIGFLEIYGSKNQANWEILMLLIELSYISSTANYSYILVKHRIDRK